MQVHTQTAIPETKKIMQPSYPTPLTYKHLLEAYILVVWHLT